MYMATYQVPPDTREKEKVIGGLLNWVQFFWLVAGFAVAMFLIFLFFVITHSVVISLIVGVLGFGVSIPFALVKKMDMPLFTYLRRKQALKKKSKQLINMRKDV